MAKQLNITVRVKNLTDSTVAVARSVVSPKAECPITVKKIKELVSLVKAADSKIIEILSPDEKVLRDIYGLKSDHENTLDLTKAEGSREEAPAKDEAVAGTLDLGDDLKDEPKKPAAKKPAAKKTVE